MLTLLFTCGLVLSVYYPFLNRLRCPFGALLQIKTRTIRQSTIMTNLARGRNNEEDNLSGAFRSHCCHIRMEEDTCRQSCSFLHFAGYSRPIFAEWPFAWGTLSSFLTISPDEYYIWHFVQRGELRHCSVLMSCWKDWHSIVWCTTASLGGLTDESLNGSRTTYWEHGQKRDVLF